MNDKPTVAPMFPEPNENSSLEELAAYALKKQEGIFARDKMNGEDLWLMGQALAWAKVKVGHGEWENWWKGKGFKKTYVWQARKLHENAPTLEDVKGLGVTEALLKFGVVAEKKTQPGTKAGSGKNQEGEEAEGVPASDKEGETPTEADEPNGEHEGDEGEDLADQEDKKHKAYQESIRKLTPKTRAVIIQHSLELLREELDGEEVDEELQQTFGQIAQLAEELKGLNSHDEQDS